LIALAQITQSGESGEHRRRCAKHLPAFLATFERVAIMYIDIYRYAPIDMWAAWPAAGLRACECNPKQLLVRRRARKNRGTLGG